MDLKANVSLTPAGEIPLGASIHNDPVAGYDLLTEPENKHIAFIKGAFIELVMI